MHVSWQSGDVGPCPWPRNRRQRLLDLLALAFPLLLTLLACNGQPEQPALAETPEPTATPPITPESGPALREAGIPLMAVFAGWYGFDHETGACRGALGATHWNDSPDTGAVIHVPEIGFYCSADPEVIAWQLQRLEDAGVSVLLFSWWGWGDTNLDGNVDGHPDQHMELALSGLVEFLRDAESHLQVAIVVEPFTRTQAGVHPTQLTEAQRRMVLDHLWDRYYDVHTEQMFHWQERPLVVAFDPMRLPKDDRFNVRHWTGRPWKEVLSREEWDWSFAPPQDVAEAISHDGVAFVYPRFDEFYLYLWGAGYLSWEPRRVDPFLEEGVYAEQWRQLTARRDEINIIVLYSWNLYGEQAHIEPSSGGPAPVGHDYVQKTRRYYQDFLEAR